MPTNSFAWASLVLALFSSIASGAPFRHEIAFQDHLERAWPADLFTRTIEIPAKPADLADRLVLEIDGQPAALQIDNLRPAKGSDRRLVDVYFRTDLPAHGSRKIVIREGDAKATQHSIPDPVQLKTTGQVIDIASPLAAVRLPAGKWAAAEEIKSPAEVAVALARHLGLASPPSAEGCPGPILGVRLPSGAWTAAAQILPGDAPQKPFVRGYETTILSQGPLLTRTRTTWSFAQGGEYVVDVTLRAGEPLVRIDETYKGGGRVSFDFHAGLAPTKFATKASYRGEMQLTPIAYDKPAVLPSLVGWDFYLADRTSVIGYLGAPSGDMLGWLSTSPDWLPDPYPAMFAVKAGPAAPAGSLVASATLASSGHRHWALLTARAADFPDPGKDLYRWWTRRMVLNLDKVSTWQLVWPDMDKIKFPHTFFSNSDLPEIRQRLRAEPTIVEYMEELRKGDGGYMGWSNNASAAAGNPESKAYFEQYSAKYRTRGGIAKGFAYISAAYLYFGDRVYLEQITEKRNPLMERNAVDYVDYFIRCWLDDVGVMAGDGAMGNMNVSDSMLKLCIALDLALGSDLMTPAEKRQLLTRLAFMVYVMHDPVWQPPIHMPDGTRPEGYGQGTPNQKNCALTVRAMTACALANHPLKNDWIKFAMDEVRPHYEWTMSPSGALLESPFYSSRDTMRYAPFWSAMVRAGVAQVAPDYRKWLDRPKHAFAYLADMLTPREPRFGGKRAYHPIGRSSPGVIDPTFMIGADPWAQNDPSHGALMRWAWAEQGKPSPDIMGTTGGRNIALTLLAFSNSFAPLDKNPLRSRRYEGMGAIFRAHADSDFESNVVFRHDPFCWDLYPVNNGAVYFYGKGAPLLPRFGAYWSHSYGGAWMMEPPFGNRLDFATGDNSALGNMTRFDALADLADYAEGVTGDKHWRRAVLMAKDLDRNDPVYLLVRDDVCRPNSATSVNWWIMTRNVAPDGLDKPGVVPIQINDKDWVARMGKNWAQAPTLTGQFHSFPGLCGVDLDLFIASPSNPSILTDAASTGRFPYCAAPNLFETQQLLRISQPAGKPYLTLLTPRFPGSPAPACTTIADGSGVAIAHAAGNDRLFLAPESGPIQHKDDIVSFDGRAGFARIGADGRVRLMVSDGRISAGGVTLTATAPAAAIVQGKTLRVVHRSERKDVKVELSGALRNLDVRYEPAR